MRKVLYITGTRADYGLMRSTLKAIEARKDLELLVVVTGMHLMAEFGGTAKDVAKDGFRTVIVPSLFESDSRAAAPRFLGTFLRQLTDVVERERPDEILLLGDRAEMLAGAIVGSYMSIPTFHVHGGDVSSTVDEHVRHAITKLSHYHLAATERSADRIRRMGEEPWRVQMVGSPSLDGMNDIRPLGADQRKRYGLDEEQEYLVLLQHPAGEEREAASQILGTIAALERDGRRTVVIYPNADAGGREMIKVIEERCRPPQFIVHKSVPREDFLGLIRSASALIGNSSSGLVECSLLGTPVVNIGERQRDRERGGNVLDVEYGTEEVLRGLAAIKDPEFKRRSRENKSPYGDGKAGERIAELLASSKLGAKVTQKRLSYDI